jgi:hypothetical protein
MNVRAREHENAKPRTRNPQFYLPQAVRREVFIGKPARFHFIFPTDLAAQSNFANYWCQLVFTVCHKGTRYYRFLLTQRHQVMRVVFAKLEP